MASHAEIQAKVRELQSDSLETIAEAMLELEAQRDHYQEMAEQLSDIKHQALDIASIT